MIATERCTRCGGDGIYKWGEVLNGVATRQGECWRCHGSGVEPQFHWDPAPEDRQDATTMPPPATIMIAPDGSSFDLDIFHDAITIVAERGTQQSVIQMAAVLKDLILDGKPNFPVIPNVYAEQLDILRAAFTRRFL